MRLVYCGIELESIATKLPTLNAAPDVKELTVVR